MRTQTTTYKGINISYDSLGRPTQTAVDANVVNFILSADTNTGDRKSPHPNSWSKLTKISRRGVRDVYGPTGAYVGGERGWMDQTIPDKTVDLSTPVYNACVSRFYERVRGSLDLAVDAFEAHQASNMVSKSLKGLRSLEHTLVDIFEAVRARKIRTASSKWLEWTYGWKPLASSIYGSYEQLIGASHTKHVRARMKMVDERRTLQGSPWSAAINDDISSYCSYRCLIDCEFGLNENVLQDLARFTSLNPVSIAWELMPYSFVVDWVIDIGGYLRDYESAWLYRPSFKRGYRTETNLRYNIVRTDGSAKDASGYTTICRSIVGSSISKSKVRTVLSAPPSPRYPTFKLDLGWRRMVSAAALVSQFITRNQPRT